MIRTGMRGIIELIRKHPKIRRILRCESPYFHHCSIQYTLVADRTDVRRDIRTLIYKDALRPEYDAPRVN